MSDDTDRETPDPQELQEESCAPEIPQGESEPIDLLLEERSTPELRRWLRARYRAVTGLQE
jgi:hypothetical protein